jgi:hypothetical protein
MNDNNLINYRTTNKSNRNINIDFTDKQINKLFKEHGNILPHQESLFKILNNTIYTFYNIIFLILKLKNPIPYIFSSLNSLFSFIIVLILLSISLLYINYIL